MANYEIENNEILISFYDFPSEEVRSEMKAQSFRWDPIQKVWYAQFSQEREELARKLTASASKISAQVPSTLLPLEKNTSLDEKLERMLSMGDNSERATLEESFTRSIESELDTYVQAIRYYKKEEEDASSEKKVQEASIKGALNEIDAKKKLANDKRSYLENIIKDYFLSTGEEKLSGNLFNVSFKEVPTYSISPALEEEIRQRANLPSWISMELKINHKAFKELDVVPDGAVESCNYKIQTWTEQEGDPNIPSYKKSLEAFLGGASIKEIADNRGLKWSTVKNHLLQAINEGLLDIRQYVSDDILSEIESLRWHGQNWKISDYWHAIKYTVGYDWVSLSLSYLKIFSAD